MHTTTSKKLSGNDITFVERTHTYTFKGKKLQSVTEFIGTFFGDFDASAIAKKLALINRKRGIKGKGVRYYKKLWKEQTQEGTDIHKQIESYIDGKNIDDLHPKAVEAIRWYHKKLSRLDEPVPYTEQIVYNEQLGLAGTIDVALLHGPGKFILIDWKTNKEIHQKGYKGKKAQEPISHLDDCNYNKYALQLSLYRYLLEDKGLNITATYMVHLKEDKFKEYKMPYLKDEIMSMLEVKKNGKENKTA